MKILLTGSRGYIGSHILKALQVKYTILAPSHKELDLLDAEAVRRYVTKHNITIVIHAALVGGSRKEQYVPGMFLTNTRMFFNIARCHDLYGRLIFLGSGAEYDKQFPIVNVKEADFDKRIPDGELGLYKYICAKYIESVDFAVNLRIFGIYGPGEDYRIRFISNACVRAIQGKPITIDKNVYFDYLYVKDFVKIVDHFIIHKPKHKSYNVGTGRRIDLITIANKINKIAINKQPIHVSHRGLNNEYTANTTRLYKEVNKKILTTVDVAIKELYMWYAKRKHLLDSA